MLFLAKKKVNMKQPELKITVHSTNCVTVLLILMTFTYLKQVKVYCTLQGIIAKHNWSNI